VGKAEEDVGCFCTSCLGGVEGGFVGCWVGKVSSRLCGAVYSLLAGPRGKLAITCKSAMSFTKNNQKMATFQKTERHHVASMGDAWLNSLLGHTDRVLDRSKVLAQS